jgi:putative transposase
MRRAFRYRLFTNANQERELGIALESHRRLYNQCLDLRELAWQTEGASVSYSDCSRWFKHQRTTNPFYARLNFSSAQATMRRLDKSFANFFRRVADGEVPGYPRFKGRGRFNSIEYPAHGDGIRLTGNRLRMQHVGTIRVKLHRSVEGKIKTLTLKHEAGKWYVVVSCEVPDVPVASSGKPEVGIDVGLTKFLTTSDGRTEPNPRFLKAELPSLRVAQRAVARKRKGSKSRHKTVVQLQKIHARVRNVRREHHYQVAIRLVLAYGLIAVERLNIKGMLSNHRLARAIVDAGWAGFVSILKSKAECAGVQVVEVDPKGTSQECSQCHETVPKDLSVRWHDCPHCGCSLDRDHNAALNILARARRARTELVRVNVGHKIMRPSRSRRVYATE